MITLAEIARAGQIEFGDIIMYTINVLNDGPKPVMYLGTDNQGVYFVAELTDLSKAYPTLGYYKTKLLSRVRDAVG